MINVNPPKDKRANLEWRTEVLELAETDLEFRELIKEKFYRDPLFAFNGFFYTLNVRCRPKAVLPFVTYGEAPFDYQDKLIIEVVDAIENGHDLLVNKCRDVGLTWIALGVGFWFWAKGKSQSDRFDMLCGSRKETYVDNKGDPRTHFAKLRFLLQYLPWWLQPEGFLTSKHDHYMKMVNPKTGGTITGESNNANFSTQGRYNVVFFDEQAKWEHTDKQAWTSAGSATPCRLGVSTAFGSQTHFYSLICDGKVKVIDVDYWGHPEQGKGAYCRWPKDSTDVDKHFVRSPWFDYEEAERRTKQELWQEVLRKHLGSGLSAFSGKCLERIEYLLDKDHQHKQCRWFEFVGKHIDETNNPGFVEDYGVYLNVWRMPSPGVAYAIGVDVAEGQSGGDYSTITALSRETLSVDFRIKGKIDEVTLAEVIFNLNSWIEKQNASAIIGIETRACGHTTFDLCAQAYDMDNLFYMPSFEHDSDRVLKGFKTTTVSRNYLFGRIKEWLLDGISWANLSLLTELVNLEIRNGKIQAQANFHDDETMSFGIALCVHELSFMPKTKTLNPYDVTQTLADLANIHANEEAIKIPIKTPFELCMAQLEDTLSEASERNEFLRECELNKLYTNIKGRFLQ